MSGFSKIKALQPDNQFAFVCPIFGVETKLAACLRLDYLKTRGEGPMVRQGCQGCMSANKCPVRHLVKWEFRRADRPSERHYSATPKVGTLDDEIIEAISPILISEKLFEGGLSDGERKRMLAANEAAKAGAKAKAATRQSLTLDEPPAPKKTRARKTEAKEAEPENTIDAGDMAGAINKAMAKSQENAE